MIEGVRERETDLPVSPMSSGEREREKRGRSRTIEAKRNLPEKGHPGILILGEAEITKTPSFLNSIF